MGSILINDIDPRLLTIFDAVFSEGSVTRAAYKLGVTQSTVSHALARLRDMLKDDLFVPSPQGMRPTLRAQEIGPSLHRVLADLRAVLAPREFQPGESSRTFTMVCSAYVCATFLPRFAIEFQRDAPLASLRVRYADRPLAEELGEEHVDLAITLASRPSPLLVSETIFTDHWVAAIRADLVPATATLEDIQHMEGLTLISAGPLPGQRERDPDVLAHPSAAAMSSSGRPYQPAVLSPAARLHVPDSAAAIAAIQQMTAVAICPARLAAGASAQSPLKLFPLDDRGALQIMLSHSPHRHDDAANRWLREIIGRAAQLI